LRELALVNTEQGPRRPHLLVCDHVLDIRIDAFEATIDGYAQKNRLTRPNGEPRPA
jgi:hypothetical protein